MKCALELLTIKTEALQKAKEEQERQRKLRKEQVIKRTYNWCDTHIDEELQKEASSIDETPIVIYIPVRFNDDLSEFCPIYKQVSSRGNTYWSGCCSWMDYTILVNYLNKHCLKVERQWKNYTCWNLSDFHHGADLIISIANPECL